MEKRFLYCLKCKKQLITIKPNIKYCQQCGHKYNSKWWSFIYKIRQRIRQFLLAPRFIKEIYLWWKVGRPTRTLNEINFIYDNICKRCPHFQNDICNVCGCNIIRNTTKFNKLALKNMSCPDNPPRWGPKYEELLAQKGAKSSKFHKGKRTGKVHRCCNKKKAQ